MLYQMKKGWKQIRPGMKLKLERKRRLNLWELASEVELEKREREIFRGEKGMIWLDFRKPGFQLTDCCPHDQTDEQTE